MVQAKRQADSTTGIENTTYDVMTVLTNKLQGVAALQEYKKDAQGDQEVLQCFEEIEERERKDIDKLRGIVAKRLSA